MQISRRNLLRAGLSSIAITGVGYSPQIQARAENCGSVLGLEGCQKTFGSELCLSTAKQASTVKYSSAPPPVIVLPWTEKEAIPYSTVTGFDVSLKANVLKPLRNLFGVNPLFAYYDENKHGGKPNAIASPDGKILFGTKLLTKMLSKPNGDFAVMAACAHEFGHIKQYETGVQSLITRSLPCYCIELHADFLAGVFIRHFESLFAGAKLQSIGNVWSAWDKKSCSHGSRSQRLAAIETGYSFGDPDRGHTMNETLAAGVDYLQKYK